MDFIPPEGEFPRSSIRNDILPEAIEIGPTLLPIAIEPLVLDNRILLILDELKGTGPHRVPLRLFAAIFLIGRRRSNHTANKPQRSKEGILEFGQVEPDGVFIDNVNRCYFFIIAAFSRFTQFQTELDGIAVKI